MAKTSGLGDRLFIGGNDISGDINAVDKIAGPLALINVTDITQSANSRLGGKRDGAIDFTAYFDPAIGASHPVLAALPTGDVLVTYIRGAALGNPAANMWARQVNYDGTRSATGELTFKVSAVGDAYGLEWCDQLTAGPRTDTAATNGASVDLTTVSTAFGWQAYLQAIAITGTSCTVDIQDSADGTTFADLAGATFTAFTAGATFQRLQSSSSTATVRRYLRVITSGTFSSATFAVSICRNLTAQPSF